MNTCEIVSFHEVNEIDEADLTDLAVGATDARPRLCLCWLLAPCQCLYAPWLITFRNVWPHPNSHPHSLVVLKCTTFSRVSKSLRCVPFLLEAVSTLKPESREDVMSCGASCFFTFKPCAPSLSCVRLVYSFSQAEFIWFRAICGTKAHGWFHDWGVVCFVLWYCIATALIYKYNIWDCPNQPL